MQGRARVFMACFGLAGCLVPLRLTWRFDAVGEYGSQARRPAAVAGAEDVKIFYANSPPGFSLRENELKVEPGYEHEILGIVTVVPRSGDCLSATANKDTVIAMLHDGGLRSGANAVIYAHSRLSHSKDPTVGEVCPPAGEPYGSGWAVIVHDSPPSATR